MRSEGEGADMNIGLIKKEKSPMLRGTVINIVLAGLLLIVFFFGCNVGQYRMSIGKVFETLFGGGDESSRLALFEYRLPRLCLAILVGLGMGMSGA